MADGNQIIDRNLKTPYEALTPVQMVEYIEMDKQLVIMDKLERQAKREAEQRRKRAGNPFYRLYMRNGLMEEESGA